MFRACPFASERHEEKLLIWRVGLWFGLEGPVLQPLWHLKQ